MPIVINSKAKIFFLVGPTAIGKTEVAVGLAKRLNAEIISCDSMQIYKGMDIITAKPKPPLRKKVRHHLIDIISPAKQYNVAQYRKDALKKIVEIIKRGKTPLFVGGGGLYMSILIDGIFALEAKNKTIRKRLYKQAQKYGSQYLYRRLQDADYEAALKIHPNDAKRIIRALEVFESSGKPISYFQRQREGLVKDYDIRILCLNMQRERLIKRIDERVEKMFANGLAAEVKNLLKFKLSNTASFAIGMRELKGYFEGLYDLEEVKQLIKKNTRLYAKRQLTWFRKDKRIKWINIDAQEKPPGIANRIYSIINIDNK